MLKKLLGSVMLCLISILFIIPTTKNANATSEVIVLVEGTGDGSEGSSGENAEEESGLTAEEIEAIISQYEIGDVISPTAHITDANLYSKLTKIISKDIEDRYGIEYDVETLYTKMFKDIEEIIIDESLIKSLSGLEYIHFDSLKTLKVTRCQLTSIDSEIFERMPLLETIDFTANEINAVELGEIPTLKNIELASNDLSVLNLENLGVSAININVAQNSFENMSNIIFPTRVVDVQLNIINNKISDISDGYLNLINDKKTMKVGVQNINEDSEMVLDTSTPIRYYRTNIPNLKLNVYKYNGFIREELPAFTFSDDIIEDGQNFYEKKFAIGEYVFEYSIDDVPAYNDDILSQIYYECGEMSILPSQCTVKYEHKGEMYDTFDKKVTGKVTVHLYAEEGAVIMYKVNSGEWQTGNEVHCDRGGNYTIRTKAIIGDVESKESVILVRTSQNVLIPDIVMLVLVLLFTLGLFMVVVPYVSKKFFNK